MFPRKNIQLIINPIQKGHVSQDTILEFERTIQTNGAGTIEISSSMAFIGKLFEKLIIKRDFPFNSGFVPRKNIRRLCIMMGIEFRKPAVPFLFNKSNHAYFFDAWPKRHAEIERFIRIMNIKNVFFSSAQVTEIFTAKNLSCNFHWVPEGINLTEYLFKGYSDKDIDVLFLGRKYDLLHEKIVEGLSVSKTTYLYEKTKGEIIFKERDSFIEGLARTKISICVPSNITHPERAGEISTMTVRYLQSMASKALVVGFIPEDMKGLFDYDPIITVDMKDPLGQIKNILENYSSYIPLIEKNYNSVKEHHCWTNRWSCMLDVLNNTGE
jgi:hypothetical protein